MNIESPTFKVRYDNWEDWVLETVANGFDPEGYDKKGYDEHGQDRAGLFASDYEDHPELCQLMKDSDNWHPQIHQAEGMWCIFFNNQDVNHDMYFTLRKDAIKTLIELLKARK